MVQLNKGLDTVYKVVEGVRKHKREYRMLG